MTIFKKILKWLLYILVIPLTYVITSLILTEITVEKIDNITVSEKVIFLNTNGIHLDVILSINDIDAELLKGLKISGKDNYLSFGWGDENFYLNTATWDDLTFNNAFQALFMSSPTLMHVTRYNQKQNNWVKVRITETGLKKMNNYISNAFKKDENGHKIFLKDKGYSTIDDFYKAEGSYSCFKTCNSWVNSGFIESGLKSCYWTPFDYGLLNKHK